MTDETSSAERWDKRYRAAAEPPFGEAPSEYVRMIWARSDFAPRRVLSLADGDGRNGAWIAEQGCAVTAVDCSAVATERAGALDRRRGVTVTRLVADLAEWSPAPGESWDAVFVIYLQGTSALRRRTLAVAASALAPGGWLVVEGFSKAQAGHSSKGGGIGPEDPDRLYDLAELRAATPGLQLVEALAGRIRLDEGARHSGEAEVVRFAARRPL